MSPGYLVGRGVADVTGEAAECGMLGYGKAHQSTAGIHLRLRCRSFVIAEPGAPARRVLIAVAELPLMFDGVRRAVLARLAEGYGPLYGEDNVMLTVTHTHSGPGGYAHHRLYNATTRGFRPRTFAAIVDGITESAVRAHEDLGPAELYLTHGELHDASTNRSPTAFARNPEPDRAVFPTGIDPQTTLLRAERGGRLAAAINWFATHGTSMTNTNRLISSDNKGYAAYHWERLVHGVDYLGDPAAIGFLAAFAQTNAGDMSPNLHHRPGSGPTEDEFENTRIIGRRQYEAAAGLSTQPSAPLGGGVDYRLSYVDLSDVRVTVDGRPHRTTKPFAGAAALAGTDEGPGFPGFRQGRNPVWDGMSAVAYRLSAPLRDSQAPKGLVLPGGLVNRLTPLVPERVPVQLIRIGRLYLIGIPGEVTIVAGLRLRRAVAAVTGAGLPDVLAAGYSNGYIHYVTTPEEYLEQRYEGGSTLFGRWELPALEQAVRTLATAMRDGAAAPPGPRPEPVPVPRAAPRPGRDAPPAGRSFGAQLEPPAAAYRPGDTVRVTFAGTHPATNLHRGGTYLYVERDTDQGWAAVADDGDWSTTFRWARQASGSSAVTITWTIPGGTAPGRYRIRYYGDAADGRAPHSFTGTSTAFLVRELEAFGTGSRDTRDRGTIGSSAGLGDFGMERTVRTPDGRTLAVDINADPAGRPVLVHMGTPNSRRLYGPNIRDAAERGIRLISYDRPGYGGSSPRPGRTVADCAEDVRAICAALHIDRLAMWGISGGGPHVLACAALLPDLVTAAASLAGLAPYDAEGLDYFAGMGQANVDDIKLFFADEAAARAKMETDREEMLATPVSEVTKQLESLLTPTDAAVLTGDLAEYLVYSGHEGMGLSGEGWWEDNCLSQPWGFKVADISVPVLVMHGREDMFVPFGHGEWLARHIPGAQARLLDHDGHLTLFQNRIPEVHAWLAERL